MDNYAFNYDYGLIHKINEIKSGVIFAIKITNLMATVILPRDKKECDRLMAAFVERLQKELEVNTFRYNHDTLFILSRNPRIIDELNEKIISIGVEVFKIFLTANIGYTEFQAEQPNDVINRSLAALDIAIQENQAKVVYSDCTNKIHEILDISEKSTIFYNSIKRDQLKLLFQPIIDVESRSVLFHEGLLRINERNTIYDLILASEQTRLISLIDSHVVQKAIDVIQNSPDLVLSVNFSIFSLNDESWVERIFDMLSNVPFITRRLVIEITENSVFNKYDRVFDFMVKFKSIGCKIAIDDFGESFHIPFLKLEKLPVDFIKLDGNFARAAMHDENVRIFIDAIIKIANNSGIKVIAELVENSECFELFKNMGIRYMQGNFFHKTSTELIKEPS